MKKHSKNGETGDGTTDSVSPRMLRKKAGEKAAHDEWLMSTIDGLNGSPKHTGAEPGPQLNEVSDEGSCTSKNAEGPEFPQAITQVTVQLPTSETEVNEISDGQPTQSASEVQTGDSVLIPASI